MEDRFTRTGILFGTAALEKLSQSYVTVSDVGGVGSYVVEVLVRSRVREISLIDNDEVSLLNISRQLVALYSTLGQKKMEVARKHILGIDPYCRVHAYALFYLPEIAHEAGPSACDYVVGCINTIATKLEIIKQRDALYIPVIACMEAVSKMDATRFKVADISKTQIDPLAKVIRKKLRELGIAHLKVVYNDKQSQKPFPIASTRKASSAPEFALSAPVVTSEK